MCFSLEASLVTGAALEGGSLYTVIKKRDKRTLLLLVIPFILGLQQLAEAILWWNFMFGRYELVREITTYFFAFFAFVWWPVYVPVALIYLSQGKDQLLYFFLVIIGVLVGSFFLLYIIELQVVSRVVDDSIQYSFAYSGVAFRRILTFGYALATILPFILSPYIRLKLFGIVLTIGLTSSLLLYQFAFVSVWCFFAAVLSIIIFWQIRSFTAGT